MVREREAPAELQVQSFGRARLLPSRMCQFGREESIAVRQEPHPPRAHPEAALVGGGDAAAEAVAHHVQGGVFAGKSLELGGGLSHEHFQTAYRFAFAQAGLFE